MTPEKYAQFCDDTAAANYALVESTVAGSVVLTHADNLARESGRLIRENGHTPGGHLPFSRGFENAFVLSTAIWAQRNGASVDVAAVSDALVASGTLADVWADYVFEALCGETVRSASGVDDRAVWAVSTPVEAVAAVLAELVRTPTDRSRAHARVAEQIRASFGITRQYAD